MKVLLIDDEYNIRKGLMTLIDWESLGCEIIGEASDGVMALEQISKLEPDLCIIDIKMPELDGISVIEKVCKESTNRTKFIVLSGFGEFEYAKRAMACHVKHYVLKPIDEDVLIEKVQMIREDLSKEDEYIELTKEQFLKNVIMSNKLLTEEDNIYIDNMRQVLSLPWKSYQVLLLEVKNMTTFQVEVIIGVIDHICHEYFNYGYELLQVGSHFCIILKDFVFNKTFKKVEQFENDLNESIATDVMVAVGCPVKLLDHVNQSYVDAKTLFEKKYLFDCNDILNFTMLKKVDTNEEINQETIVDEITKAIHMNQLEQINNLMEKQLVTMLQSGWSDKELVGEYIQLYIRVMLPLISQYDSLNSREYLHEDTLRKIYEQEDLRRLNGFIKYQFAAVAEYLSIDKPTDIVLVIKDYIKDNYMKDIKIEELAKFFGYHSGYLGKQFKDKVGMPFNKYLDSVRISASHLLLKDNTLKIYEIAKRVGFNDPDYFAIKFKKYEGVSPNQYRKQYLCK